jgi:hypothetical protein
LLLSVGECGDQLVGRVVSGLPVNDARFTTLPPHLPCNEILRLAEEDWGNILPDYNTYPQSFRSTIPYLLASLVFHSEWLRSTLPSNHPVFNLRVFTNGFVSRLLAVVENGYNYCSLSGMTASGIPKHVTISVQVDQLSKRLEHLESGLLTHSAAIISKFDDAVAKLPQDLKDMILEHFQVNGAIPITMTDLTALLENMRSSLRDEIRVAGTANMNATLAVHQENGISNESSEFDRWDWGGKMRRVVPPGFTLPTSNVKQLWELWYYGDKNKRIGPYKKIPADDLVRAVDKVGLTRLKSVMMHLEQIC